MSKIIIRQKFQVILPVLHYNQLFAQFMKGVTKKGIPKTQTIENASICPAKGSSIGEFKSLYRPATNKGIIYN